MRICPFCSTRPADTEEHVIPSAIGGRLVVDDLLCKPCNDQLGATIDADLAKQFEAVRMMLAIEGDRGQTASVRVQDADGRELVLEPGLQPRYAVTRPRISRQDAQGFEGTFDSVGESRTYAEAIQRKNPGRKVVVTSVKRNITFPARVTFGAQLRGGDGFFRSSLKSVLTFLASRGVDGPASVLAPAWRCVGGAPEADNGVSISFGAAPAPWTPEVLGDVSHRIVARSNVERGFIEADVRYFGNIAVVVRIACSVAQPFSIAYGIDPISRATVASNAWDGAIGIPYAADGDQLERAYLSALGVIGHQAKERELQFLSRDVVLKATQRATEVYPDGEPRELWAALTARIISEEVARLVARIEERRPAPELLAGAQPRPRR